MLLSLVKLAIAIGIHPHMQRGRKHVGYWRLRELYPQIVFPSVEAQLLA